MIFRKQNINKESNRKSFYAFSVAIFLEKEIFIMENKTNCIYDNATYRTFDMDSFIDFVKEREENAAWVEIPTREICVASKTSDECTSFDETDESRHIVNSTYLSEPMYLRDIAYPSLSERANISGYALNRVSDDDYAEIINKCLAVATGDTLLRVQDGKAAALMSKSAYRVIPTPDLYQSIAGTLCYKYDGSFVNGFWSHSLSSATFTVAQPVQAYEKILESKLGMYNISISMQVVTSDTGYSGVNYYPKVVGQKTGYATLREIPILGNISLPHKGNANIDKAIENIDLSFAQASESSARLSELDDFVLNYPFNCLCNALQKCGIGKIKANTVINKYAEIYAWTARTVTAADIYFAACELIDEEREPMKKLAIEELVSRMLKFTDSAWNELDKATNGWKLSR